MPFLSSADFFLFSLYLNYAIPSVFNSLDPDQVDILWGLIWVETVCSSGHYSTADLKAVRGVYWSDLCII